MGTAAAGWAQGSTASTAVVKGPGQGIGTQSKRGGSCSAKRLAAGCDYYLAASYDPLWRQLCSLCSHPCYIGCAQTARLVSSTKSFQPLAQIWCVRTAISSRAPRSAAVPAAAGASFSFASTALPILGFSVIERGAYPRPHFPGRTRASSWKLADNRLQHCRQGAQAGPWSLSFLLGKREREREREKKGKTEHEGNQHTIYTEIITRQHNTTQPDPTNAPNLSSRHSARAR